MTDTLRITPQNHATAPAGSSPFDAIRQVYVDGVEYWSARDLLMGENGLGYADWRNAEQAINRAMKACERNGRCVGDHFVDSTKMVPLGSGGLREVKDYDLSRYACYLVAMNGDPSKEMVAAAQTYFAVQTRKQELAPDRDERWAQARLEGKTARRKFTDVLKDHDVVKGGYAFCSEAINRHVLGTSTKEFRSQHELKKSEATRDHCTTRQLGQLTITEDLAAHRIERDDVRGNGPCSEECGRAAREVAQALSPLYAS